MTIPDPLEEPTIGVPAACALLGVSTWAGYASIQRGDFPVGVCRIGRAIRVPTRPLLDALGLTSADAERPDTPAKDAGSPGRSSIAIVRPNDRRIAVDR